MGTQKTRLENAERTVVARLPTQGDLLGGYSNQNWADTFSEILGRVVPACPGGARGAMEALPVPDLKAVLEWLKGCPHVRAANID